MHTSTGPKISSLASVASFFTSVKTVGGTNQPFSSMLSRVVPAHLMDRDLFDFVGLKPTGVPDANGDTAFDAVDPDEDGDDACGDTPEALEPGAIVEKKVMFTRS